MKRNYGGNGNGIVRTEDGEYTPLKIKTVAGKCEFYGSGNCRDERRCDAAGHMLGPEGDNGKRKIIGVCEGYIPTLKEILVPEMRRVR
ncbi:MAG: hypothetical protein ABIH49_03035 [archaeon]